MKSRVYVYNNKYSDKNPVIEYYDYDWIEKDGSSKAYIFTLSREVYDKEESIITKHGRDYERVLTDLFTEYEGWKDLKEYFNNNSIPYEYKEIVLSKEDRYSKQRSQFGEHRCAAIHCSKNLNDPSLNEFERDYVRKILDMTSVKWEIPFGWEEDDFEFLRSRTRYYYLNDIGMLGKKENNEFYIYERNIWQKDVSHMISDRLNGYDPSEPDDSPYKYGNSSVLFSIDEISRKEAYKMMNESEETK